MEPCPTVSYERPDCKTLSSEGYQCVDMHFHTEFSDCFTSVQSALKLAKERSVGLAITDHNIIKGSETAIELSEDVMIVPGIELNSWDGPHILAYFYDFPSLRSFWERHVKDNVTKNPWKFLRITSDHLVDLLEKEQCVVSAAHPFGCGIFYQGLEKAIRKGLSKESVRDRVDAYEVLNSCMSQEFNAKARDIAKDRGLCMTGGTDSHYLSNLGTGLTVSKADSVDSFLDNIKKKRNSVMGVSCSKGGVYRTGAICTVSELIRFPSSFHSSMEHKLHMHDYD